MEKYPKVIGWDIETEKITPEPEEGETLDIMQYRPLGISCAAAYLSDEPEPMVWYHGMQYGYPRAGKMTVEECMLMLTNLWSLSMDGYMIATWNGNFDWDILAEETNRDDLCSPLARDHVDMMYHFFCTKGFPLSLDAAAKGQGLPGKGDMHGDIAPVMWAKDLGGRYKTLGYVIDDAYQTMQLFLRCQQRNAIHWTSKSGKANTCHLDYGWLPVAEAAREPLPNTSWMTDPIPRENFYSWLKEV